MSEEKQPTAEPMKSCPMCAEDVKAAALICRYCGHNFGPAPAEPDVPPRPEGPPPDTITANLRAEEAVLVWSPCFLNYAAGTVAITTARVLFTAVDDTLQVNQRLNVQRRVTLGASPTRPSSCRPDGTVVIEFPDERLDFHGMNPAVAREVAATVVPSLIEELFADDRQARQRLREHQEATAARTVGTAPTAAVNATSEATRAGLLERGAASWALRVLILAPLVAAVVFGIRACSTGGDTGGGGTFHVAGCRSQLAVGDHMTLRAQWTSPKAAKYTYVLLDQGNFTKNSLFDETLNSAADVPISNEWVLPGPRVGQTKTIVAELTANKAGNSTVMVQIWGSDDTTSAPPDNARAASCDVAINP